MRRTVGLALMTFGAITLLSLSRCTPVEPAEPPHLPAAELARDAGPCDGSCPWEASARRAEPSAAETLELVLAMVESVQDAAGMPNVEPTRAIVCTPDDGCRVVDLKTNEPDGGRKLERLERRTEP